MRPGVPGPRGGPRYRSAAERYAASHSPLRVKSPTVQLNCSAGPADDAGMTNPGDTAHGYQLVAWTQHWTRIDGAWYRDAVAVRLTDGARRMIAVLDVAA